MSEQKEYRQSEVLGVLGLPECPYCTNGLQNGTPADRSDLRLCANCKHYFSITEILGEPDKS